MHAFAVIGDADIVAELGRRIARHRIALNLRQDELADRAGVGRSTVQRIERGDSIQLSSFVKILRALERLDGLDVVLAPDIRSPLAELERERRRRRRVRHAEHERGGTAQEAEGRPWTWGAAEDEG